MYQYATFCTDDDINDRWLRGRTFNLVFVTLVFVFYFDSGLGISMCLHVLGYYGATQPNRCHRGKTNRTMHQVIEEYIHTT